MGDDEAPTWAWLGEESVNDAENRIAIPDGAFDADIFDPQYDRAHWSYEATVGFLLLSNEPLRNDRFKHQGSSTIGSAADGYRSTIPKRFFSDYAGGEGPVPEHARVEYGERRYFLCRDGMVTGDPKSCYVLSRAQIERVLSQDPGWNGLVESLPRFA